jgi:hypothetical protein
MLSLQLNKSIRYVMQLLHNLPLAYDMLFRGDFGAIMNT